MAETPATEQQNDAIDATLGLKMVSIRLSAQLVEDLKIIASITNSPYQAVMRKCLVDFACEHLIAAGREYLKRGKHKRTAPGSAHD